MTSKVRCQGCKVYKSRDGMRKVGLGYVCNSECVQIVRSRKKPGKSRLATDVTDSLKNHVRNRDENKCRWCGSLFSLHVHHVDYRSQGGGHVEHNLITLCLDHHGIVHSDKKKYQPILRATIWLTYSNRFLFVPEVEALVTHH